MKCRTKIIVEPLLNVPCLYKIFGFISPLEIFPVSIKLFIAIEKKLIFFYLVMRLLLMSQKGVVTPIIWIILVSVRVVRNYVKLVFVYLT